MGNFSWAKTDAPKIAEKQAAAKTMLLLTTFIPPLISVEHGFM